MKALDLTPELVVSLDDPFDPEFAGLANRVEAQRRALCRELRGKAAASDRAWAHTRLAVNLIVQGQHRPAQAELTLAEPDLVSDLPTRVATLRRALHSSAAAMAAARLSVRTEPVIALARVALQACGAVADEDRRQATMMRLPAWAWAVAEVWLGLDPDPTPASRAEVWTALEPIWQWPSVWDDGVSLPWLVRMAQGLVEVGAVDAPLGATMRSVLQGGLAQWRPTPKLPLASYSQSAISPPSSPSSSPGRSHGRSNGIPEGPRHGLPASATVLRPLALAGSGAADEVQPAAWHPLAIALGDAAHGRLTGLPASPWREDAEGQSLVLSSLAEAPIAALLAAPGLDRALVAQAGHWHGPPSARLHLAAARLATLSGDDANATRHLLRACGLRLPPGSVDLAHARAVLTHLSVRCLQVGPALRGFETASPRRKAVWTWLQRALPACTSVVEESTQQAELAALAGDRGDSLRWRWEAVAAARFAHGRVSAPHLSALHGLRDALALHDPDHPDLETVHDDGADIAGRLWGALSADHWWWRGMRALWWQARGHGGALRALAQEAEETIELTVAAGDRAACACMRELIDSARQVAGSLHDEPRFGTGHARVQ